MLCVEHLYLVLKPMYVLHLSQWRNYVARRPCNGVTSDGVYSKPMKENTSCRFDI